MRAPVRAEIVADDGTMSDADKAAFQAALIRVGEVLMDTPMHLRQSILASAVASAVFPQPDGCWQNMRSQIEQGIVLMRAYSASRPASGRLQ